MLDFYEDCDESSKALFNNIDKVFKENNLNLNDISAYSADNASVNYGIHKWVFKNLKNKNKSIIKANCNCHVLHNAAKYGLTKLSLDIENLQ